MIELFGLTSQLNVRPTAKDPSKKFGKFEIEDLYGSTPAVIFNRTIEECGEDLCEDTIALFKGKIQISNDIPEMIINSIEPAAEPESMALKGMLEISFAPTQLVTPEKVSEIKASLLSNPGESKVRFVVYEPSGGHHVIRAGGNWSVNLSSELIEQLNGIIGPNSTRAMMEKSNIKREAQPAWKSYK
jgi:DNA polymerase III alpha subunit